MLSNMPVCAASCPAALRRAGLSARARRWRVGEASPVRTSSGSAFGEPRRGTPSFEHSGGARALPERNRLRAREKGRAFMNASPAATPLGGAPQRRFLTANASYSSKFSLYYKSFGSSLRKPAEKRKRPHRFRCGRFLCEGVSRGCAGPEAPLRVLQTARFPPTPQSFFVVWTWTSGPSSVTTTVAFGRPG